MAWSRGRSCSGRGSTRTCRASSRFVVELTSGTLPVKIEVALALGRGVGSSSMLLERSWTTNEGVDGRRDTSDRGSRGVDRGCRRGSGAREAPAADRRIRGWKSYPPKVASDVPVNSIMAGGYRERRSVAPRAGRELGAGRVLAEWVPCRRPSPRPGATAGVPELAETIGVPQGGLRRAFAVDRHGVLLLGVADDVAPWGWGPDGCLLPTVGGRVRRWRGAKPRRVGRCCSSMAPSRPARPVAGAAVVGGISAARTP